MPCCCLVAKSCATLLRPHGWYTTRHLCSWDFPGKNTGVGYHFLLQRIFPTQGSNPCLLHWQVDSLPLSHLGSPLPYILLAGKNLVFFAFLYFSWGSQGKNTEVVCHSLLQWTTFCENSPPQPVHLGWPYTAWLIVSLS